LDAVLICPPDSIKESSNITDLVPARESYLP